jgi:hypothetical protein
MQDWESSSGKFKDDERAFIFSIDNHKVYKVVRSDGALYCNSKEGPAFGGHALRI